MKSKLRSLAKTKRQRARRKALHDIKDAIRSWANAFTLCDDTQKIRSYWLARAHEQFRKGPDSAFEEEETMSNAVYRTFKLHPDQEEIVDAALENIKKHTGTDVDTVALEYVCTQYMGTGTQFGDLKSHLNAEYKKAGTLEAFLQKVVPIMEKISGRTLTLTVDD